MSSGSGASPTAKALLSLFEQLKPELLRKVNSFQGAAHAVDANLRSTPVRYIAQSLDRGLEAALHDAKLLELLLKRKKATTIARILLFEILKREPARLVDANGKDIYSTELNFEFAVAACTAQFGKPLQSASDGVVDKISQYRRNVGGSYCSPANAQIVELIARDCRRF